MSLSEVGDKNIPYVPLSSYYFFYFAAVGAVIPYLGLYLQSLSFDALQIAQVVAVLSLARIVSPPFWAWLADRRGQFLGYVQLASLLSMFFAVGYLWLTDYLQLLWLTWWMGFFWHAALPPMESLTLKTLESDLSLYSRIRLWGSVGFIVAVLGLGMFFDRLGFEYFPQLMLLAFILMVLSAWWNKPTASHALVSLSLSGLGGVLKQPMVWLLLAVAFFNQLSHGVYYAFYSILLNEKGFDATIIGWLWTLGVLAEIALFWVFGGWIHRFSIRVWLMIASVLTIIRWSAIAVFADVLPILMVAQLLHAASFAVFHAVMVQWLHQTFAGYLVQGQALYSSLTYGLGGVLGSLLAGYAWVWGQGLVTFSVAALSATLALVLVFFLPSQGHNALDNHVR